MNALREADAVVYDALAPKELLDLVPAGAALHDVGKRGHDAPTRPQPEITALLVALAREGKTVVRLKGGDPFVFGRGGEEATACAEAGVDFEVIPGVSSAIGALAYAGIPVTDRRYAASFAVVTGHKDPTEVSEETRWGALATAVDTLVILMGSAKARRDRRAPARRRPRPEDAGRRRDERHVARSTRRGGAAGGDREPGAGGRPRGSGRRGDRGRRSGCARPWRGSNGVRSSADACW